MIYGDNRPISCTYCGYAPAHGREETYKDNRGNIVVECKWICPRCTKLISSSIKSITPPVKEIKKL